MSEKILKEPELIITYKGKLLNVFVVMLISLITAMISILSTSTITNANQTTVFFVFLGVLIVELSIYYFKSLGIICATVSSLLFCFTVSNSWKVILINVIANTVQAILIYFALKISSIENNIKEENKHFTDYKFVLLIVGILYVVFSFLIHKEHLLYIFSAIVLLVNIVEAISNKSMKKIPYFIFMCVLPCLFGALLNSITVFTTDFNFSSWYDSFSMWFFSNIVLFSTFGYLLLSILSKFKPVLNKNDDNDDEESLKLSSVLYYFATLCWNILFYAMYIVGWFDYQTPLYLFPWLVGNIFFIANMLCTLKKEVDDISEDDAFEHFERRAVVAEQNTQILISVVAFLVPLSASLLGNKITICELFVFILNITCGIISIGLIWVPKNHIRFMELIKNLKTIFHLFTLSLLLLSAVILITQAL